MDILLLLILEFGSVLTAILFANSAAKNLRYRKENFVLNAFEN
jgi:hypothetical protein